MEKKVEGRDRATGTIFSWRSSEIYSIKGGTVLGEHRWRGYGHRSNCRPFYKVDDMFNFKMQSYSCWYILDGIAASGFDLYGPAQKRQIVSRRADRLGSDLFLVRRLAIHRAVALDAAPCWLLSRSDPFALIMLRMTIVSSRHGVLIRAPESCSSISMMHLRLDGTPADRSRPSFGQERVRRSDDSE